MHVGLPPLAMRSLASARMSSLALTGWGGWGGTPRPLSSQDRGGSELPRGCRVVHPVLSPESSAEALERCAGVNTRKNKLGAVTTPSLATHSLCAFLHSFIPSCLQPGACLSSPGDSHRLQTQTTPCSVVHTEAGLSASIKVVLYSEGFISLLWVIVLLRETQKPRVSSRLSAPECIYRKEGGMSV